MSIKIIHIDYNINDRIIKIKILMNYYNIFIEYGKNTQYILNKNELYTKK